MLAVNAGIEAVAAWAGDRPHGVDPKDVGEPGVCAALSVLVEHRRLEGRHQGAARGHIVPKLLALAVA